MGAITEKVIRRWSDCVAIELAGWGLVWRRPNDQEHDLVSRANQILGNANRARPQDGFTWNSVHCSREVWHRINPYYKQQAEQESVDSQD